MPVFIPTATPQVLPAATGTLEFVSRNCELSGYEKVKVKEIAVSGKVYAFASPDSTFAVHKRLLDQAKKTILIGIYDFTAAYVKDLLLRAISRGVKIELMLDIDNRKGESALFDELASMGVRCVPAPSCASSRAHYFSSSHEKVIVIDDDWVIVQSGNYTENSIPLNLVDGGEKNNFVTGNRDMGLAFESRPLAKFFRNILQSDIQLELNAPELAVVESVFPEGFWIESAPIKVPEKRFSSKAFSLKSVKVLPVLSPDNYMDVVPGILRNAKKSVAIEQQYIRSDQDDIVALLTALRKAMDTHPKLVCRIILGKIFDANALAKERKNLFTLAKKFGLKLGTNIRYIDLARFEHCHNKLIIVDGTTVLVGSQNWSSTAVSKNREASVLLTHQGIAGYFASIFDFDWSVGQRKLATKIAGKKSAPEMLAQGKFVRLRPSDYMEV